MLFRQSFFCQCLAVALFAKLFDRQSFLLYGNFIQLLKPTIECDKLQYQYRDTIVHEVLAALCSPMHNKCMEVLHISYTMCTCGLLDIYILNPQACSPWASGVYIREITHAHGIIIKWINKRII